MKIFLIVVALVGAAIFYFSQAQQPDLQSQKLQATQGVNATNATLKNIQAAIEKNNADIATKEAERVRLQNQKAAEASLEKLRVEIEQKRIANAMLQAQFEAQIEQDKIAALTAKTEADKAARLADLAVIVAQNKAANEQAIAEQNRMTIEQQGYTNRERLRLEVQQAQNGATMTLVRDALVYAVLPAVIVGLVGAFGVVFVVRHWQMAGANILKKRAEAIQSLIVVTKDGVYKVPIEENLRIEFSSPMLLTDGGEQDTEDQYEEVAPQATNGARKVDGKTVSWFKGDDRRADESPDLAKTIAKYIARRTPLSTPTPFAIPIAEPEHDPFTKKVLSLLDASIAKHGKASPYIASDDAIEWDGRDWQPAVDALKGAGAVMTQGRGRPANGALSRTRVSEQYQTLSALREAVETGGLAVTPPLSLAHA